MMRAIFVLVAAVISVTAVTAQPDPMATRKELMKKNTEHGRIISGIVKGAQPFNAAVVNAAFTQWSETAAQLPKLFPEGSNKGDSRALPKIWSDREGFNAQIAGLAKASAARPKDVEELKKAFDAVNRVCSDCHEGYRAAAKR
jgi:cytochrome c556